MRPKYAPAFLQPEAIGIWAISSIVGVSTHKIARQEDRSFWVNWTFDRAASHPAAKAFHAFRVNGEIVNTRYSVERAWRSKWYKGVTSRSDGALILVTIAFKIIGHTNVRKTPVRIPRQKISSHYHRLLSRYFQLLSIRRTRS